ncbi:MAG: poly-gamma-glutamate system protein [Planctomycetota bacterium]|jgi:poly-gamma-glutamate system protein
MKKLYWRPHGISPSVLTLIALVSLAGLIAVEFLVIRQKQPYYQEKLSAAQFALEGMEIIKSERLQQGVDINPELDPTSSALVGSAMTPVTTVAGSLSAKQTSINPNFASVVVEMLKEANVKKGDVIAVGVSGSFPSLSICVYAAARTLELQPIIVTSASASQFGANDPDFLWIDMERILHESNKDKFPYRTVAASLGGVDDRGLGISREGRQLINTAVERNGLTLIKPKDFKDSLDKRMVIYAQHAVERPIKAYINIGGGTVSVGTATGKRCFVPGLNMRKPAGLRQIDSIMSRFIDQGIPVIHLVKIEDLAKRYGLPLQPITIPSPGEGKIFYREEYNQWLAGIVLLVIVISLYLFVRSDLGYRIIQTSARKNHDTFHEPMV